MWIAGCRAYHRPRGVYEIIWKKSDAVTSIFGTHIRAHTHTHTHTHSREKSRRGKEGRDPTVCWINIDAVRCCYFFFEFFVSYWLWKNSFEDCRILSGAFKNRSRTLKMLSNIKANFVGMNRFLYFWKLLSNFKKSFLNSKMSSLEIVNSPWRSDFMFKDVKILAIIRDSKT